MSGRFWLGLAFGAVFLALAFSGVSPAELGPALARMDRAALLPITALFALQLALRARRQQLLLAGLAPQAGYRDHLAILCVGFLCINTFPARLGEAVRPLLFRQRHGIALGAGFGVVFAERALDLLILVTGLLWVLAVSATPSAETDLARRVALAVLLPLLAALAVLVLFPARGLSLLRAGVARLEGRAAGGRAARLARGLQGFAEGFVEGLGALRQPRSLLEAVALSLLAFALSAWMVVCLAEAFDFGDRIGFVEGLGVTSIASLGVALPAPPAFAGVFEGSVRGALALFGVGGGELAARALAFALVLHAWILLLQVAAGSWFLWRDRLALGELFRSVRRGAAEPPAHSTR